MKYLVFISLLLSSIVVSAETAKKTEVKGATDYDHSMWVEPNYVDTQYSALLSSIKLTKIEFSDNIYDHIPFGWIAFKVKAQVDDIYKGALKKNESINLVIYISALSSKSQLEKLSKQYILSFCQSNAGDYYTSRDYLIQSPSEGNLKKFEWVRQNGTDYEGTGDCDGNYPSLNPDTHN